jgi:DNA-binding transcriptional MerR regulator
MKTEFLFKDLKKIFPWISPRTLISWAERGLVKPFFGNAAGRGTSRRYSYENLIEIAFISELLKYKISFSIISDITNTSEFKTIISEKKWDTIFWTSSQIVSAPVPMDKEVPSVGAEGFCTLSEFHKGNFVFNFKRLDNDVSISLVTSAIVINFYSLNYFVSEQIKKVC